MPASKAFERVSVAAFSAALAFFAALAQYSSRIAVAESRLSSLEATGAETGKHVAAIYDALVKRGIIAVGHNGNTKSSKAAAQEQTAVAIANSVGFRTVRSSSGAVADLLPAFGADCRGRGQGGRTCVGDSWCTARSLWRDRAGELLAGQP
jgi:hypothetical protein